MNFSKILEVASNIKLPGDRNVKKIVKNIEFIPEE